MLQSLRAAAVLAVAIAFIPSAHAEDKDKAREAYRAATQHYDFGEYQQALDGFKEAYKNYEDPAFLFNVAQCHRALGHKQEAITFYESYLRNSADASNREEVQHTISELRVTLDAEKASSKPMVTALSLAPPAIPATQLTSAAIATTKADKPTRVRKWVYGVVAAAVVVVGLGIGLGVGLGAQQHAPKPSYGSVSF